MASLESSSPHDNDKNETALTFCHAVSNGTVFEIPSKINIVTIMKLGDNCPLNQGIDTDLQTFVTRGFKFFEYNSVIQTPACASLQHSLNSPIYERNSLLAKKSKENGKSRIHPEFNIRNHVEGSAMNNATLSFHDSTTALMDTMIYDEHGVHIKTVPIKYPDKVQIDLTRLTCYLCGLPDIKAVSKMNGRLTIVLIICRGLDKSITPPTLQLMRQLSEKNDFLPLGSYVYIHGRENNGLIGQLIEITNRYYKISSPPDGRKTTTSMENVELLTRVQLSGLQTVSKNGLKGTFIKELPSGRFQLKMDDGSTITVNPINLIGLHEPSGGKHKTHKHKRKNTRKNARLRKVSRK